MVQVCVRNGQVVQCTPACACCLHQQVSAAGCQGTAGVSRGAQDFAAGVI